MDKEPGISDLLSDLNGDAVVWRGAFIHHQQLGSYTWKEVNVSRILFLSGFDQKYIFFKKSHIIYFCRDVKNASAWLKKWWDTSFWGLTELRATPSFSVLLHGRQNVWYSWLTGEE